MKSIYKIGWVTVSITCFLFSCEQSRKPGDSTSNVKQKSKEVVIKSNLKDFQQRKVEFLDSEYLYKGPDGKKSDYLKKARVLTKNLLSEYSDTIINWDVKLKLIALEMKTSDISLLKTMSPNNVVKRDPTGRTMTAVFDTDEYQPRFGKFSATLVQESNKVTPKNGIRPTDSLYRKLAGMTTGLNKAVPEILNPERKFRITAKVLAFEEYLNVDESHTTILYIKLINIQDGLDN